MEHDRRLLLRKISRSRKANNPQNYNKNGTIKRKAKLVWQRSNRYNALIVQLNELLRHQAAVRRNQHIELANTLLELGDTFIVENNSIDLRERKTCNFEVSEKEGRGLKKRNNGKSYTETVSHTPSVFVTILKNKVQSLGGRFIEVDPKTTVQVFDFIDGSFHQHESNDDYITLSNGNTHRRDLLTAFNLQHLRPESEDKNDYDVAAMIKDYPFFCHLEGETCRLDPKKETREKEIQD